MSFAVSMSNAKYFRVIVELRDQWTVDSGRGETASVFSPTIPYFISRFLLYRDVISRRFTCQSAIYPLCSRGSIVCPNHFTSGFFQHTLPQSANADIMSMMNNVFWPLMRQIK
jgi:hypothetical protein